MSALPFNMKTLSALALAFLVTGLSGCYWNPCQCDPDWIAFPEDGEMVAVSIQEEHYFNTGDWQNMTWEDPDSPFFDVLEMDATWVNGQLIVDYVTEDGDFQAVFETVSP